MIDGKEDPAFNVLGRLVFSSDGRHDAYVGISGIVSSRTGRGKGTTALITYGKKGVYGSFVLMFSFRMIGDTLVYDRCCHVSTIDDFLWLPDSRV